MSYEISSKLNGGSSQRDLKKRFSQFLNSKDLKDIILDYSSNIKPIRTPREKKILFTKTPHLKIRRSFFDDYVINQTEEDKQWYKVSKPSTQIQEKIDLLENSINELMGLNKTNFFLYDMKQRESKIITNELKDVKDHRNRVITEKSVLANELDFQKV
jgi:hypothetical protein